MIGQTKWVPIAVGLLVLGIVVSCSVTTGQLPGGGGFVSFTIGNKTFTFTFGDVGRIQVQANQPANQAGALKLFDTPPTATPSTGQMTLLSSGVSVTALPVNKSIVQQQPQPLNGTAAVRFSIASGMSADLCDQATFLGQFELTVVNNVVTVENETVELDAAAIAIILTNEVTMCIEVTADFDGELTMTEFSLAFGPDEALETTTAAFTFRNDDMENIHFLLPGQDFPDNRVGAGQTGTGLLSNVQVGDTITIRAGRNGAVLDSTSCPTVSGTNYSVTVVWDGVSVTCEAEQSGGGSTAADLAGCWRVTANLQEQDGSANPQVMIFDIDSAGNLATLWSEAENPETSQTLTYEMVRFTTSNAGFFAEGISNPQQEVSVNAAGTQADFSFSFNVQYEDNSVAVALNINDASLSGSPPSGFVSNAVTSTTTGESGTESSSGTATGQRVDCPDASREEVVSQEEFVLELAELDLCGSGTAMMMPLMLLGLVWLKFRR